MCGDPYISAPSSEKKNLFTKIRLVGAFLHTVRVSVFVTVDPIGNLEFPTSMGYCVLPIQEMCHLKKNNNTNYTVLSNLHSLSSPE